MGRFSPLGAPLRSKMRSRVWQPSQMAPVTRVMAAHSGQAMARVSLLGKRRFFATMKRAVAVMKRMKIVAGCMVVAFQGCWPERLIGGDVVGFTALSESRFVVKEALHFSENICAGAC